MKVTKGTIKEIAHQVFKELKLKEASVRDIPEDDGLGALKELVANMANGKIPVASAEDIITAFQLYFEGSYLQAAGELRKGGQP